MTAGVNCGNLWPLNPPQEHLAPLDSLLRSKVHVLVKGHLADARARMGHVRFTPKSGHAQSRHRCLQRANSGHKPLHRLLSSELALRVTPPSALPPSL